MKNTILVGALLAIASLAGIFALAPIQYAAAPPQPVLTLKTVSNTCVLTFGASPSYFDIFVSCDQNFVVTSFQVTTTHNNALDDFDLSFIQNGPDLAFVNFQPLNPSADLNINHDIMSYVGTPIGVTANSSLKVAINESATGGSADTIGIGDVNAIVQTQSNAVCSISAILIG